MADEKQYLPIYAKTYHGLDLGIPLDKRTRDKLTGWRKYDMLRTLEEAEQRLADGEENIMPPQSLVDTSGSQSANTEALPTQSEAQVGPDGEPVELEVATADYDKMSKDQLVALAKERRIANAEKLNQAVLVRAHKKYDEIQAKKTS